VSIEKDDIMNNRFLLLTLIIIGAALTRFLPHPPNFSPIAAMALFGGVYFTNKKWSFIVPMGAMLMSDLFLGLHGTLFFVYASFALVAMLGIWQQNNIRLLTLPLLSVASSILFFIITNFGVWATGSYGLYPMTIEGLQAAFVAGLPFLRNTMAGDLVYVTILFGSWSMLQQRFPVLRRSVA
jgi:hypothetical protein